VATLREKMKVSVDRITTFHHNECSEGETPRGCKEYNSLPDGYSVAKKSRACIMIDGKTPEEKAAALFSNLSNALF
jgi:hypothetical protein